MPVLSSGATIRICQSSEKVYRGRCVLMIIHCGVGNSTVGEQVGVAQACLHREPIEKDGELHRRYRD